MALEEVMVYAQKRVESLQDVPISVTAIPGESIQEGEIMSIQDVAAITPNFTVTQFNIGEPQYFIRGIGSTNDSAGSDPAVGTFIDDVYIGRTGGASMDLYDLERIEVLRGPQGTLFGKNVVGGAVSIYTLKPSQDFSAKLGATVGNYGQHIYRGLVTGGLTDTIAGKFSFSQSERDGYVENVLDGLDYGGADNLSMRGQLLFQPSDSVEVLFGADYSTDDQIGNCRNVNNLDLHNPLGLAVFYPPVIAATTGGDIRKCASSVPAYQKRDVWGSLLRIDWSMEVATLTSLTAYREADYKWSEDLAGMPLGTTPFNLVDQAQEASDQISQEFRLTSDSGGTLDWLVGLFYMKENVDRHENFIGSFGAPIAAQGFVLLNGDVTFSQDNSTQSYAAFGQVNWHITDSLTWSVGGRWAKDKKDIDQSLTSEENPAFDIGLLTLLNHPNPRVVLGIPANGPSDLIGYITTGNPALLKTPYAVTADNSWSQFVPSSSLNWQVADNHLVYFTYSEGYKSGAFQSTTTSPNAATTPLEPELATNYEIGYKGEFANNRLRLGVSTFTMDYKDLQVYRLVGSLLVGANAQATSKGVEVDASALLTENWLLNATYGYLDATYDTFTDGLVDYSGNQLPKSPENQFSVSTSYTLNFSSGSTMEFQVGYSYSDGFYFDPSNAPATYEDSYGLLDARLGFYSEDGHWELSGWARNITDEEFRTHTILSNIAGTVDLWNLPRTYGVSVAYNFF